MSDRPDADRDGIPRAIRAVGRLGTAALTRMRRRTLAPTMAAAMTLATIGAAFLAIRLLDYSTDHFREANTATDVIQAFGRLTGSNWDLVRDDQPTSDQLQEHQQTISVARARLTRLTHARFDRGDIAQVAVLANGFLAGAENEHRLLGHGFMTGARVSAGHNDSDFHAFAARTSRLVAELRTNADHAARQVKVGLFGLGAMFSLTIGSVVWWGCRRRSRDAQVRIEAATKARFEALVERGSDLIVVTDPSGDVQYISSSVSGILGYPRSSSQQVKLASLVHPDDLAVFSHTVSAARGHGEAGPVDYRLRHFDGSWRTMELSVTNMCAVDAVGGFVWSSRDVTDRRALEAEFQRAAFEDPVTHLANRALFMDRLHQAVARAERSHCHLGVLLADLDGFKQVNDSLGHEAGDRALMEFASRLSRCVRPGDTVARLGGDEFTILLEDMPDPAFGELVAQRVLDIARAHVAADGRQLQLGVSIGVVTSASGHATASDLLRKADTAMYAAKTSGRNRWTTFEPAMHEQVEEQFRVAADLGVALERSELEVFYQPTVWLPDSTVRGVEALVRWHHPERGLVLPGWFIRVAEQTGHIVPIGRWVLARACEQAAQWQDRYPTDPALTVSVNLSARQLAAPGIVEDVRAVLDDSRLQPDALTLEITESVLMDNVDEARRRLHQLKDLGVNLAIDDFGTGYSSLAYLRQLPIDILKIDRAFTQAMDASNPGGVALVRAIIDMSAGLGLTTIAEGIELETQANQLQTLGCQTGQGFLYARPMPAADIALLLGARTPCLAAAPSS